MKKKIGQAYWRVVSARRAHCAIILEFCVSHYSIEARMRWQQHGQKLIEFCELFKKDIINQLF